MKITNFFDCSNFKYRIFQYLATIGANIGILSTGMHYGWSSTAIPILTSGNYTFQLTNSEASWLASIVPIAGMIADILAGLTALSLGRKRLILLAGIPLTLSWVIVATAKSKIVMFLGRFLAGLMDGLLFTSVPQYLAEISDPEIRGFIGSSYAMTIVLGMLIMNVLLFFLSINTAAYIASGVSLLILVIVPLVPESPYFHLLQKNIPEAQASLQKFRGRSDVVEELNRMSEGIVEEAQNHGKIKDLIFDSFNRKALILSVVLTVIQQLSGITAIVSYGHTVFEEGKDFISPDIANIIYFVVYFVATTTSLFLIDITGRRPLILFSITGSAISLFLAGTYLYIKHYTDVDTTSFNFLQLSSVLGYTIIYSIGLNTVPLLISSEIFPSNVRGLGLSITNISYALVSAGATLFFSWTNDTFGMHVPFFGFCCFCILGLVYIIFMLPETKEKSLEEIQMQMRGRPLET